LNYLSFMVSAALAGFAVHKPDIIVATSPQFFCGWAGVILAKVRRVRFILEIRDIWPESIETVGAISNRVVLKLLTWLERRLYSAADHIVTVGEGYRAKLVERGVTMPRVTIISSGVESQRFTPRPAADDLCRQYGLTGNFVCSFIGTVGMACGLEILLRASKLLKDSRITGVKFLVVGDGATLESLCRKATEGDLRDIVFAGLQPKEKIPEFLALSDACLIHKKNHPLFETHMPYRLFETLAMARPVILGVRGLAADLLQKAGAGICIEPENEVHLLEAIQQLKSNPLHARSLGQSGREYVLRHFDYDSLANEYLRVIGRVCAESNGENAGRRENAAGSEAS
jgi:glycosyltransferase involved in cell wall biosynthesis